MYQWLMENMKKYFAFIKILKEKENGEICLYKHIESEKYVIVRKLKGIHNVYDRMLTLKQQNLPLIYEVVLHEGETIVLEEFVEGITVSELLTQKVLTIRQTCGIAMQVCDGLSALHSNQIIHRDIKPENIMVMSDGKVKIIDFDAAKIHRAYSEKDTRMIGTIGYAAPEQYGEAQSDERTDIYGLGIMMNVMLTRKHPVNETVTGEMGDIIEKCIMVNPEKRYKTVLELKMRLKKFYY